MLVTSLEAARENAPQAKRVIVINRFNRYSASREFMEVVRDLIQSGEEVVTIAQSEVFNRCYTEGKSILDIAPKTNAGLLTLRAVNTIREMAGLDPDPTNAQAIKAYLDLQAERAATRRAQQSMG